MTDTITISKDEYAEETAKEANARAISDHNEITKLKTALFEINNLRSSTRNFGLARAIACEALGIKHTDSTEPPSVTYSKYEQINSDQRQILLWCASLEEAKLNGEFDHKPEDSYFLKQVKTICQLATMDIKE
jgi:hypothetical protein